MRCHSGSTRCASDSCACTSPSGNTPEAGNRLRGDEGWYVVWRELAKLHEDKAADYGTAEDGFANYVQASRAAGQDDEFSCWLRIFEKSFRALNLLRQGRADENKEATDVAALAIGAEALRRRRI